LFILYYLNKKKINRDSIKSLYSLKFFFELAVFLFPESNDSHPDNSVYNGIDEHFINKRGEITINFIIEFFELTDG
jgi:hypothetical protein